MSRRVEFLIEDIKRGVESQLSTTTSGVTDLEILHYINSAQDRIFHKAVCQYPSIFVTENTQDIVADQESYSLPNNSYLGTGVIGVEYKYGSGSGDYESIPSEVIFKRRTDLSSVFPLYYIRRGSSLLLNPVPSSSITNGLRVTYQRRIRDLDVRRGIISSTSKTGTTLNTVTLDLTPSLGKDDGTVQAARDMLNKADYICIINSDGASLLDAIPIDSYDYTTGVITVRSGYTTSIAAATFEGYYIAMGDYSSTHSEMPATIERYLVSYGKLRLMVRMGSSQEGEFQRQELQAIESDILDSFASPDFDMKFIPPDAAWRSGPLY